MFLVFFALVLLCFWVSTCVCAHAHKHFYDYSRAIFHVITMSCRSLSVRFFPLQNAMDFASASMCTDTNKLYLFYVNNFFFQRKDSCCSFSFVFPLTHHLENDIIGNEYLPIYTETPRNEPIELYFVGLILLYFFFSPRSVSVYRKISFLEIFRNGNYLYKFYLYTFAQFLCKPCI